MLFGHTSLSRLSMISSKQQLLFGLLCIPSRLAIAYIASRCVSAPCVLAFGGLAIAQAVSWFLIYARVFPRDTGLETFGKPIWWNHLRPVHAVLHLLFAATSFYSLYYSYSYNDRTTTTTTNYGSLWLVLDVCVGGIAHLMR